MNIVFVDNYDSFANTIASYFKKTGATVSIFKSDCSIATIQKEKPDLIVLGPGPNSPKEAGNYLEVIKKFHADTPLFGICLGFQALMEYFGEPVQQLQEVVHGAASPITHDGKTIFKGIPKKVKFARYHSLGVYGVPDCFEVSATTDNTTDNTTGNIVMAARHKTLPIEAIQFHPESILSMENNVGEKLIKNVVRCVP